MTHTLPQALLLQASTRGSAIALRYKQLGIWQTRTWSQVAQDVGRLAAALQQRGFTPGDALLILSQARVEALLLTLAVQWLGGYGVLLDPQHDQRALLARLQAAFVLAEDLAAVQQVQGLAPQLLLYLDGRGLDRSSDPSLCAYAELLGGPAPAAPTPAQDAEASAFVFYLDPQAPPQHLSHRVLLDGAQQLIRREALGADEEALAARVFAASGQARYLLAPWLSAGFRLNFPEALETRDADRRELGPSLVLGTRESYARLEQWARERLPLPGTWSHRLYHWALAPAGGALRRSLGHWLIRRPLLDVLGLSRLRVPLLVGPALTPQSAEFFAALGIQPRRWQEPSVPARELQAPTALTLQSV